MHCLERLYLTHNEFEEISRNITELVHLTTLDLSHNHISHLPPTKAWTNTRMNKLSLAFNNLMTITHQTEEDQTYTRSGARPRTEGERRGRSSTAFATYVFLHVHYIHTTSYREICDTIAYTIPDIIKFTYYHYTSIDYSVLYE